MNVQKSAVSVAEMAKMVGLSRARFYQLVGVAFPPPVYDVATRRPFYPCELQQACLEVRRQNRGIDGRPVLFYARQRATPSRPDTRARRVRGRYGELVEGLKSLGLVDVTAAQVEAAVKALYPSGMTGMQPGETLRAVFLYLKHRPDLAAVEAAKTFDGASA